MNISLFLSLQLIRYPEFTSKSWISCTLHIDAFSSYPRINMHKQHNARSWALDYKANQNFPLSHFSHYHPPISRLPVELLSEIFLYACTFRKGYHGNLFHDLSPFDKRASPMNLSLTDSHWRQVAISIPIIWSNLKIYSMFPRHPSLLKLWLQRSRNAPLHIALDTRRYCWSSNRTDSCTCEVPCPLHEDPRTNEILSLLVEHSSRWEAINFNICMYQPTPLLSLNSADLPGLKSACLYDDEADRYHVEPEDIRFANEHQDIFWKHIAASSLLEEVTIYGGIPDHVHWNRLKSLCIETPFLDLSVLQECVQLEHLAFGRPCSAIDPSSRIVMLNLKKLELTGPSAGPGLTSFVFPSLESLSLCTPASRSTLQDLLEFMQHSRPPLKSLLLDSSCWWGEHSVLRGIWDPSALIELLSSSDLMAKLTSLTMRGCPSPPHLIHFLSSPHSSSLPVLENLSIEYPATIVMKDIIDMITLRNCGGIPVFPLRRFQAVVRDGHWDQMDPQNLHYEFPESGEVKHERCTIAIRTLYDVTYSNINVA